MANEITGMWGATDLNDLIRGLKMMIAQAEDVRACGGTLEDLKAIGTCGTCSMRDAILCEDAPANCHECDDYWKDDENDWDNDCDDEEDEEENEWYRSINNLAEIMTLWSDGEEIETICDWQDKHQTSIEQLMVEVFEGMGYTIDLNKARKKYKKNHSLN